MRPEPFTKRCPRCKLVKNRSHFYIGKDEKISGYCKLCMALNAKDRRINTPEAVKRRSLLRRLKKVGLTLEEYRKLPKRCVICGSKKNLHLDHNHRTGKFRGILCGNCNTSIGLLNEDAERIRRAAQYVEGELTQAALDELPTQLPK